MRLTLTNHHLRIQLDGSERLWAFHLSSTIDVPLEQITRVAVERPSSTWRELRAPGTFLPGVIKAGTYYTERGREFWYVPGSTAPLLLDLMDYYYKRMVLSVDEPHTWAQRLTGHLQEV